jgi:hypothetical protein
MQTRKNRKKIKGGITPKKSKSNKSKKKSSSNKSKKYPTPPFFTLIFDIKGKIYQFNPKI